MKILIMPIFKFINLEKKNSEMEFLTSANGTNRTLQSVDGLWCEPIILLIRYFKSPIEVELNRW